MNKVLGRWGAWLLVPQIVIGCLIYNLVDGYTFATALFCAGVWAAIVIVVAAIFLRDSVGVVVAISSLTMVAAAFAHVVPFLAVALGLCSLVLAAFAAVLVKLGGLAQDDETFIQHFIGALPVVGGLLYLSI